MANCAANGGKWIRKEKRLAIYLRDGLACVYCGCAMEYGDPLLTLDHVVSQEHGGGNTCSNLVTACRACNSIKYTRSLNQFLIWFEKQGCDTSEIKKRIQKHTRRKLKKYKAMATLMMKNRK